LQGEPGTPEFVASFNEAAALKVKTPSGWLLSLLQRYQASDDFRSLADRTKADYAGIIIIEPEFADFPLSALTDKRTRGVFLDWRDKLSEISSASRLCLDRPGARPFLVEGSRSHRGQSVRTGRAHISRITSRKDLVSR